MKANIGSLQYEICSRPPQERNKQITKSSSNNNKIPTEGEIRVDDEVHKEMITATSKSQQRPTQTASKENNQKVGTKYVHANNI